MKPLLFVVTFLLYFPSFGKKTGKILFEDAKINYKKGLLHQSTLQLQEALILFEKETPKDTITILDAALWLSSNLLEENRGYDFLKNLPYLKPYLKVKHKWVPWLKQSLATAYSITGDLEQTQSWLRSAESDMKDLKMYAPELAGNIWREIGMSYYRQGDFIRARTYLEKALNQYAKINNNSSKILNNINTIKVIWRSYYLQKDYKSYSNYLPVVSQSFRLLNDSNDVFWGNFYLDLSQYFIVTSKPDSAISYAQRGLQFHQKHNVYLTRAYRQMGDAFYSSHQTDNARTNYILSLKLANSSNDVFQIAKNHEGLSKVYQSSNPMLALGHIQMALWSVGAPFRAKDFHKNPDANDFKFRAESIGILQQKVLILKQLHQQTRQTDYLKAAFATAKTIDQLIEKQRLTFLLETSKFELAETAHQASDQAIELAFELYQTTHQSSYLHEAFYFAERSRLFVLYESVRAARTPHFEGVPDSLIVAEQRWQRVMATEERKNNSSTLLTQAIEKSEKLKAQFKANYPAYYQYRYEPQPIVIDQVQQSLSSKAALIEYFVGQAHVFVFVVRPNACHLYRLAKTKKLETDIATFKQELQAGDDVNFLLSTGNRLYNALYKNPVGSQINDIQTLTLVPDGFLNGLPFETLITRPNATLTQPTIFLIEQATIEYAQSATMRWRSPLPSAAVTGQISYTGFSPKYAQNDLPLNRALVASLADKLGGVSFLGANANRSTFADISKNSSKLLHLSMHGGLNTEQTDNPFLLLNTAKGQADTLTANDIYGLRVQAQLVLLDACESGVGDLRTGEGTLNLARSFVYAGCPSVAMSYWKLTSKAQTQALIQFFSEKSIKNLTKSAEALQNAKLEYIAQNRRSLQYIHPKFWSPIVVYVSSNQAVSHYRLWVIGGLLTLVLFLYFLKKLN
jgi:CHAT domain-containing protein